MNYQGQEYQTTKEYAKLKGVSEETVLEWLRRGKRLNGSKIEYIELLDIILIKV